MKKSQAYETFSYSQSYSPTSPVAVRADNSQSNNPAPSFHMEEYQRAEPEEDPVLSCTPSPVHPSDHSEHGFQPSYASDGAMPGSSRPYRGSARVNSSQGKYSPDRSFAVPLSGMLAQGEPSSVHAPEMMSYSALVENRHIVSSLCFRSGFGEVEMLYLQVALFDLHLSTSLMQTNRSCSFPILRAGFRLYSE